MNLHLFDTATGQVRKLEQREPGKVSMYVCGPTVYDLPHIGHGRSVLVYDILRRYLESRGVEVRHVSNITDIDDKIIKRAHDTGRSTEEVVAKYEREYFDAMDGIGALRPHATPHATEYVDGMIRLITELIDRGYAYETSDTVYFAAEKVPGYGLLARQDIESLQSGARVEADEHKRSPVDFALWKKAKPGEPTWDSPWGAGRPGWHTECVVMSLDILDDDFDIHGGGIDLAFPHHENERAQAVALGNRFARHWVHNGFVEVAGEKMSKSLDNFTTITDMIRRVDPRAYRMLVLRSHYRSPVEVTPETVADAEGALARLDDFARRFGDAGDGEVDQATVDAFNAAMDDDLDTPKAVAEIFSALREANADADAGRSDVARAKAGAVLQLVGVVGLTVKSADDVDEATADLVRRRDEARATRNWAEADALRDELQRAGWVVEDTPKGTKVHR